MDKTGECVCIGFNIFGIKFQHDIKVGDILNYKYDRGPVDYDGTDLSKYTVWKKDVSLFLNSKEFFDNFVDLKVIREEKINKII